MKRFKVHAEEYQDTDDMGYAIAPPVMHYHVGNSEIGFNFDTEKEAEMLCEEWNKLVDENESKDKAIASLDDCQKNQSHSLNRLSMENKELKKQNEYLKSSDNITRLEIQIRKLKEENKKLQSEISWENIKYGTLKILYDENKELKAENEQLKKALKNKYNCEICENCKFGQYEVNWEGEGEFECLKGHDAEECDGKTGCEDFELDLERFLE